MVRGMLLLVLALALALPGLAGAQSPGLEIVSPEKLALSREDGETGTVSVWVRNSADSAVRPALEAVVEDGDGDGNVYPAVVVDDNGAEISPRELEPGRIGRYRVFLRAGGSEDQSGRFVARGMGAEGSIAVSIKDKSAADRGVTGALLLPVIPALLLIVIAGLIAIRGNDTELDSPLPPDLDFKESFASTVTLAGAILATVLAASVLPDETTILSKEAFVALNLIFGVGIVVAGLVYAALQQAIWVPVKDDPTKEQRKMQGTVGAFLAASLITLWAVFGELFVVWLLLEELGQDEGFSGASLMLLRILVVLAGITMAVYTLRRIPAIVASERDVEGRADKKTKRRRTRHDKGVAAGVAAPQAEPPRSVSLL